MKRTPAYRARRKQALSLDLTPTEQKLLARYLRAWERKLKPLRDAIEESQRITEKDLRLIIRSPPRSP